MLKYPQYTHDLRNQNDVSLQFDNFLLARNPSHFPSLPVSLNYKLCVRLNILTVVNINNKVEGNP
jgi:hypothetical protein